jgi:DNA-binding LacI/PurR family transcriptional regulator
MAIQKRATMADVSERAGVSQSAVSVVLSGRDSNIGVSESTRSRILEAARKLNYRPSFRGRSLVQGKSFLIGLLCRPVYAWTLPQLVPGVQSAIDAEEYSLVTYFHDFDPASEAQHIRRALDRELDGLMVMPAMTLDGASNVSALTDLKNEGYPIVQIFGHFLPGLAAVTVDHYAVGYLACRHLIELGHRRIVHLTHDHYQDDVQPGTYKDARDKWDGYEQAMLEAGLDPVVITCGRGEYLTAVDLGYDAAEAVKGHVSEPTGVVAFNDFIAAGLMQRLQEFGVSVPDEISIIGADNQEITQTFRPPLTTFATPIREIGVAAGQMLLDMVSGKHVRNLEMRPEIFLRGSTAVPPEGDASALQLSALGVRTREPALERAQ